MTEIDLAQIEAQLAVRNTPTASVLEIARWILERHEEETKGASTVGIEMTPFRLHFLCYRSQAHHLAATGRAMFVEPVLAGPDGLTYTNVLDSLIGHHAIVTAYELDQEVRRRRIFITKLDLPLEFYLQAEEAAFKEFPRSGDPDGWNVEREDRQNFLKGVAWTYHQAAVLDEAPSEANEPEHG